MSEHPSVSPVIADYVDTQYRPMKSVGANGSMPMSCGLNGSSDHDVEINNNDVKFVLENGGHHVAKATAENSDQAKFEQVEEAAKFLLSKTKHRPQIAIICGTGLGGIGELITDGTSVPYETIPYFVSPKVKGHAGRLLFGMLNGRCVVCMLGRIHAYEGHSMWQITFPVRVFQRMGVRILMVTNASGCINPEYEPGDIMIIKDHINLPGLSGLNPLIGLQDERFGIRFPPMSDAYDYPLRVQLRRSAEDLQLTGIREGVYVCQTGPCFETVAECRMMKMMGGDTAGMSTAPEVIVARHGQHPMRVVGLSLITNRCMTRYPEDPLPVVEHGQAPSPVETHPDHDTILQTAERRAEDLRLLVATFISRIDLATSATGGH